MDLVKKIIVSILTIVGIALAGLIICAGVLVVFPNTKIFGVSYINTVNKNSEQIFVNEINTGSLKNDYTIEILAGNYNVELTESSSDTGIDAYFISNVIGFTKELDSNKKATLTYTYDEANKKVTFTIAEPNGLFLKRDTVLKIAIPKKILDKRVNIISTTNKGVTTFGTTDTPLTVNDVTVSCLSASGGVKLQNAVIKGDLNIKNILGRVEVVNDIKGTVTINSTVGTYTFGKINNLVVVASEEGKTNNPAITLDECKNIDWKSESGSLNVKNYVLGDINVITKNANFNIAKALVKTGVVSFEGDNSNVHIAQIGNFVEDSTSNYNSFNWKKGAIPSPVITINSGSGNISINRSFFDLALSSTKGKIDVKNAMRIVDVETKSGSINIDFIDSDSYKADTELDTFIKNNFVSYLDGEQTTTSGEETTTTYKNIESLKVNTVNGAVTINNIRNSIEVISESSPITLNYKAVRNVSTVKTSSKAVTIKAPIDDFKITTKMDKNSSAKLEVKFGKLILNAYSDDLVDSARMRKYNDDQFKCLDVKVNNASDSTANIITVTNTTGKISITSY